jgi:drug/metabolite transporter (DMT)-like permease
VTEAAARAASWRATLFVVLAACGFGSISVLMVVGQRHGLTLASAMAWRYFLATPFLLAIAGAELRTVTARRGATLLVLGGLGQVAVSALSLSALGWIDVATLGFLFYTFPAWVALLSVLRGVDRVDARKATALTLALGGIAVILGAPHTAALPATGVILALSAAFIYAAYIPTLHWLRGPLSAATASAFIIAGAATVYLAAAAWRGELHFFQPAAAWGVVATLALVCTVATFIAFLNGLAVLGAVRTAIISTVEPFYTAVLGAIVLGQAAGPGTIAGGVLIAAAVLLLQRQPNPP